MVRASGTVDNARGLGVHDHVCWSFDGGAEFRRHARDFLADGLTLGQRVCYVGDGSVETLEAELCEAKGMAGALRTGAASVMPVWGIYGEDTVVEPEAQVARYAAATERALADGFAGLRVAADVTSMVRRPAQLDAFARYEHLIDRYMTARPFAALCGYNRGQLGREAVAQLACMHPSTSRGATPFRLYGSAELAGELDLLSAELFPLALRRAAPEPRDGHVVLDASKVTFIDHRSLLALDDHARDRGITLELRTGLATPIHVIDVLRLTGVHV